MAMAGVFVRFPVRASRDGADHVLRPRIRQMTQPEGDRILAVRACQFVDKGLDRKNVALPAKRAQRGGAYRHGEQAMAFDLPGWKIVERYGVAIGATAIGL